MSASELIREALKRNPNPTPEEIKQIAEEVKKKTGKGSPSLVYKWLRKIPEAERRVVEAGEPVVRAEEEPEIVIEEPAEEEFQPPTEEEIIEEEVPIEEEAVPLEAEEESKLREIAGRAVKRFFGVAIEEGLQLGKEYGLDEQEAEDTTFLSMLIIAKYLKVEVKEYMLEVTSGLHFGSIGLKLFVGWLKKRREEAKRKEEEEKRRKPEPEKPVEEKPLTSEEEVKKDEEAEREKRTKEAEKDFVKRVTGGK